MSVASVLMGLLGLGMGLALARLWQRCRTLLRRRPRYLVRRGVRRRHGHGKDVTRHESR